MKGMNCAEVTHDITIHCVSTDQVDSTKIHLSMK